MHRSPFCLLPLFGMTVCIFPVTARALDSEQVQALMINPPRQYATGPLWVWNDMLTEEQVIGTLHDLAGQNVKQAFVHPRPGLMTPYLSEEWFKLWAAALAEAERLDMNLWIYDENSYPSGFAGGWVPELMPESRGRGLFLHDGPQPPKLSENTVAIFRATGDDRFEEVTALIRAGNKLPDGRYMTAVVQRAPVNPWHGGRTYVDLLYPGVTEKFLDVTLEPYRKRFGAEFGKRIPGAFTDEPELRPAGGLPWTPDLPEVFRERWGYSLVEHLPSLFREVGDWKRVRHNYYQVLNELFIERWARPYHDYCKKHHLEFTGHYWEHAWPIATQVPDNMAMYAWQQRPGIDCLMNQYGEGVHAQFGNVRAVRELSSVANQLGKVRTLCETYGAGGWDLRFEDMKRIGDWLYVLGVNTMNEHLSYITLRGARKRDHPQSFSYHEPWWPDYHVMATYWARLSAVMSQGEQINAILLIEPTTTAWMYNREKPDHPRLGEVGDTFQKLVQTLEAAQVEYDLGCEDIIARHGSVEGQALKIGRRSYTKVVLPPFTENLNARTVELLEAYARNGGRIIGLGQPPALVDGRPSERGARLAPAHAWLPADAWAPLLDLLRDEPDRAAFRINRAEGDKGKLFHHRRRIDDGQILFLVNTSIEQPSSGSVTCRARGVERWNLDTGKAEPYFFKASDEAAGGVTFTFELPPCGSLLLFLSDQPRKPGAAPGGQVTEIKPAGPPEIRPLGPNVLVLDYVDVSAGGETKENLYFYKAQHFIFQTNGLPRNPWDSAVQFKDEIITKTFPANSSFEANYKFMIAAQAPEELSIVIERPDLYTITCNGEPVSAAKGQWWLDRAFGRIDLSKVARQGENVVTLKASPFTVYHELEPAYLLGDFTLRSGEKGFVILPSEPLKLGRWNDQGRPFDAAGVSYTHKFNVPAPVGRYRVHLPAWYGSVARIKVNGQDAGRIFHAPWECDVTERIKPGENTIEVIVIGTLKNTLGPHHGNPPLGSAWPGMFHQAPETGPPVGREYATIGYGLFEPAVLRQVR